MKKEEVFNLEKKAVELFGIEAQLRILQEECGELVVAVSHYMRRRNGSEYELCEELADVRIMVEQISTAINEPLVNWWYECKLECLDRRINDND